MQVFPILKVSRFRQAGFPSITRAAVTKITLTSGHTELQCAQKAPQRVIVFHEYTLCVRGSTRAVFDYASYSEELLGHKSVILYNRDHPDNDDQVIDMFCARFEHVFPYRVGNFHQAMEAICREFDVHLLYAIKDGNRDEIQCGAVRCAIHAMFAILEPHGDVYAYVSRQEAVTASYGYFPDVPHIVQLPRPLQNLRSRLGIPINAFVLGRHGGDKTFDIEFVRAEIPAILKDDPNLYFIFVNTEIFISHERVFFLGKIVDPQEKADFIGSCDAMIHARSRGESFGLAICEFLYLDKPVIAWSGGYDRNHVSLLKSDPKLLYYDAASLRSAINHVVHGRLNPGAYSALVEQFSPANVMRKFDDVFIKSRSRRTFVGWALEQRKLLALSSRHKFYRLRKGLGLAQ